MSRPTVTVNLKPLQQFQLALLQGLEGKSGPIRDAFHQWGSIYCSFLQERFSEMSRGGWPPLAESTKRQRRGAQRGKSKGKRGKEHAATGTFAILRDTNTLFAALAPQFHGQPGALREDIPFGVRVGYGGPSRYQGPGGKSVASIADIASFHQAGGGRLPKREIIVDPPSDTINQMAACMENAIRKLANGG